MSSKAVKGLIFLAVFIILLVILVIPSLNNLAQKDREAKEATDEYILAMEDLYGTDRTQWPKCVLDTIEYSNTHPLIRVIQYGSTEMPDFCGIGE